MQHFGLLSAVSMVALVATAPVAAQTPGTTAAAAQATAGASAESNDALEEIVVTAQRREEALSRTPVAVTVLSAEALTWRQITSDQDLRAATPGLTVRSTAGGNQINYALRGQSKDPFGFGPPGVRSYVNEVQIGTSSSASLFDLQSVQVLKGPRQLYT